MTGKRKTRASPNQRGFPKNYEAKEPGKRWLTNRAFKLVGRACILEVLESLLGSLDEGTEGSRLMDRHVGQDLAVDFDAGLVQAVDEAAVGEAGFADGCVDTLDPQGAEVALLNPTVAGGILARTVDRGLCGADGVLAAAVEALGGLEGLGVLGAGRYATFYACHVMISLNDPNSERVSETVRQVVLDDLLAIWFGKDHRAACIADELVGPLDHSVALTSSGREDLAGSRDLEPLLGGGFRLHLGHFATPFFL
ncbi:protein of unknown function [Pseudorhizobium banfieldiae]|uniref:Uncharacterized protein n=1 Tax=Pseudorhizobium banfieldiae TaxID=1125847 RepID=L0NNG0_9HYPH|nr:protein of unknown function [Pseudorhizobium banfieldiae]